jgi:prolyl-tRNA synthetase
MKDAYSFNLDEECLKKTYQAMDIAYRNIFRRCGLAFRAVEADSGAIGGSASQEFMVLADAGEDEVLFTADEKYAANVEKAVSLPADKVASPFKKFAKKETPNTNTIESLAKFLDCSATAIVKNVLYEVVYDSGITVLVLVSIRGDQEVNEVKLQNELVRQASRYNAKTILALKIPDAAAQQKWATKPLPLGYIAPDLEDNLLKKASDIAPKFLRIADNTVTDLENLITGANETGFHLVGANWGKDFILPELIVDLRKAQVGDRAIHDPNQTLQSARGIEVGHIFQLGYKYSQAMNAFYTNEAGESTPICMGCYGIGVSRLAQAAVEQSYDKDGIIWPVAIAPYQAIVVIPNLADAEQVKTAESLYNELNQAGIETLLDDRDERAGVKFKDADLIGIPYRIVTGKSLKSGKVELVERASKKASEVAINEVVSYLKTAISKVNASD